MTPEGLSKLMEGRSSFVIAHRLSTIRDSANIMVINGGEIVEFGPHDKLMEEKGFNYARYMSRFKGKAPGGEDAAAIKIASIWYGGTSLFQIVSASVAEVLTTIH